MSALMGILSLDGAPVARERIERMACAMPELAPDGTDVLVDGPFGCAFQRCDDMPAPRHGPQPIRDAEAGLVVMACGRLDNRDDLQRDLDRAGAAMSDAAIVLAAVRRDGIEVLPGGRVLVSAWNDSTVSEIAGDRLRPLIRGVSAAADIGVDSEAGVVAIPLLREDRVEFWKLR